MASTTITLNDEAYGLLKQSKRKGESFSDVILRSVHQRADTFGELLDLSENDESPKFDPQLMETVVRNRKRRSKRS